MSDRKNAYFLQLVDEAFWDANFDDLEAADRALAVDMGFIGIVSGVVASQHSPTPDLTIDLTAGVSYDQAGRRCGITSAVDGFNCAVDENGTSTAVAGGGNERWLSVQLRFDRTLTDPQVDGNGATVYVDQDESYELAVVMGSEQAAGTGLASPYTGRPALPTDGRLVCDIVLINGQTQILAADINTARRQDFSIFSAATIPVSSGGWSFLNGAATDDVQAVLDFIDARIVRRDASGFVTHNLIPDAAARDLGEASKPWDLFLRTLTTDGNSRINGHLLPTTNGNNLGTLTGPLLWSLYSDFIDLDGNFEVNGDIIPGGSAVVDGNWIPKAAGNNLGAAGKEWDLYLEEVVPSATSRVDGNWIPKADGNDLGSATLRWEAFLTSAKSYNAIGSFLSFSAAQSKAMLVNITDWVQVAGTDWDWNSTKEYLQCAVSGRIVYLYFTIPDGVSLDKIEIRWSEVTTTTATAEMEAIDVDNSPSSVAGPQTIGGAGATRWDTIGTGLAYTVDRTAKSFRVKVTHGSANSLKVYKLRATYNATGIDHPALSACAP